MASEPIESVLERVARLDREATPGPWTPATTESEDGAEQSACGPEHTLTFASDDEDDDELRDREFDLVQADAALIASYRTDAVTLAAEVVRLREALAADRDATETLRSMLDAERARGANAIAQMREALDLALPVLRDSNAAHASLARIIERKIGGRRG